MLVTPLRDAVLSFMYGDKIILLAMANKIVQSQNINVCSKLTTGNPVIGATRSESDGSRSNPTSVHIGS